MLYVFCRYLFATLGFSKCLTRPSVGFIDICRGKKNARLGPKCHSLFIDDACRNPGLIASSRITGPAAAQLVAPSRNRPVLGEYQGGLSGLGGAPGSEGKPRGRGAELYLGPSCSTLHAGCGAWPGAGPLLPRLKCREGSVSNDLITDY